MARAGSRRNGLPLGRVLLSVLSASLAVGWTIGCSDGGGQSGSPVEAGARKKPPRKDPPPAAPLGLVGESLDGRIVLDWLDSPERDLAGYRVYRWSVVVAEPCSSFWTDTAIEDGVEYCYQVSAVDLLGQESELSMGDYVLGIKNDPAPEGDPDRLAGLTISSARVPTWNPGVEGGIPDTSGWTQINVMDYGAHGNGSDNDSDHIQAAINAANATGENRVVYFPAGTYRITANNQVQVKSKVVLKGAANWASKLSITVGADTYPAMWIGGTANTGSYYSISSGAQRGQTSMVLASAPGWAAGQWIMIWMNDIDPSYTPATSEGATIFELVQVTSCVGTAVSFQRALSFNYSPTYSARACAVSAGTGAGIEDMEMWHTTDSPNKWTGLIEFKFAANCWAKNIKAGTYDRNVILFRRATRCTAERIYGEGVCINETRNPGDRSDYWCDFIGGATDNLCWNSIICNAHMQCQTQKAAARNVFAYNYGPTPTNSWVSGYFLHGLMFHGEYNQENLMEGNDCVAPSHMDGYFAQQGPYNTLFRNRYRYAAGVSGKPGCISTEYGLYYTFDTANFLLNCCRYINYYTDNDTTYFDSPTEVLNAWLERNLVTHGIYLNPANETTEAVENYVGNSAPASWDSITFGRSLWLTAAPSWWGAKPWPGIGADVDDWGGTLTKLPAQDWYEELNP